MGSTGFWKSGMTRSVAMGALLLAVHCGGGGSESGGSAGAQGAESGAPATLHLNIESRSAGDTSLPPYRRAGEFRIAVSGFGLEAPIQKTVSADEKSAAIDGILVGAVIDIAVEAVNREGVVFKRGYAKDIAIDDTIQQVSLQVEQVPILLDVSDGDALFADRLYLSLCAEPGARVRLYAQADGAAEFAVRATGGATRFTAGDDCLIHLVPENLDVGAYTLRLQDEANGEESALSLHVQPASGAWVFPFTAGSAAGSPRYRDSNESTHIIQVWQKEAGL